MQFKYFISMETIGLLQQLKTVKLENVFKCMIQLTARSIIHQHC